MRNLTKVLALVVVVGVVSAPAVFAAGSAEGGSAIYSKKCATCHGKQGEGNPGMAKMLKVELRHLGAQEVQAKSDADLKKIVLEGTGKMKPVKLTDAEVADVIAFVRTLKGK